MKHEIYNENFSVLLKFICRYLISIAFLNLLWEAVQMPLYNIWYDATWLQILLAGLHCTGGDVLIALISLLLALVVVGNRHWSEKNYTKVAVCAIIFGLSYTIYSEWLNVYVRHSWSYADNMPVVSISNFKIGLSPILQWITIPPLVFWWLRITQTFNRVK